LGRRAGPNHRPLAKRDRGGIIAKGWKRKAGKNESGFDGDFNRAFVLRCGGASSPPDAVVKTNAPTGGALTEMITQRGKIEQGRQAAEKLRRIYSNENQQLEEVIGK
jgi:hypothetical protein